jgi:hypothetical protein
MMRQAKREWIEVACEELTGINETTGRLQRALQSKWVEFIDQVEKGGQAPAS